VAPWRKVGKADESTVAVRGAATTRSDIEIEIEIDIDIEDDWIGATLS
jgi:hypothetical protein